MARVKTLAVTAVGVGEGSGVGVAATATTVAVGSGSAAGVPQQAVPISKTTQRLAKRTMRDQSNVRFGVPVSCGAHISFCFRKVLKFYSYLRIYNQIDGRPALLLSVRLPP